MDVLICLARNAPHTVSKETLMADIWEGKAYGDDVVHRAIAKLRRAVGDDRGQPGYVETVPKRGYRSPLPMAPVALPELEPRRGNASRGDESPAIAVLPMSDHAGGEDLAYFADAVTEGLTARLQRFRTFPVISAHTTFRYRGPDVDLPRLASELGVTYIVTGTVRHAEGRVRLRLELVQMPEISVVWSDSYDSDLNNLFDLQDEISLVIAAKLGPEIECAERRRDLPERSESLASWHLVRRGLWHQYRLTREDAARALEYFQEALEIDPNSIEAILALAWWYWWELSARRAGPDEWGIMEQLGQRAGRLDRQDSRVPETIGAAVLMQGDPVGARTFFEEAIELNPSYAWAYAHRGTSLYLTGEPDAAVKSIEIAIRYSPRDLFVFHAYGDLAVSHYMRGAYDEALAAADRSLSLRAGYWLARMMRAVSLAALGRRREAQRAVVELLARYPHFSEADVRWIPFTVDDWPERLTEAVRDVMPAVRARDG